MCSCAKSARAKERERARYIRRWRTARRRCRRSSALHLHTSAQPFTRLQPLPTLTPDGTHSHHNAHAYISFLASFLPSFLFVFLPSPSSSPLRQPRKVGALPLKVGEARDAVLGDLKRNVTIAPIAGGLSRWASVRPVPTEYNEATEYVREWDYGGGCTVSACVLGSLYVCTVI